MSEVSDRWVVWSASKKRAGFHTMMLGALALPLSLGIMRAAIGIGTHFNFTNSWIAALVMAFLLCFGAGLVTLIAGVSIRERAEVPSDVVSTMVGTQDDGLTRTDLPQTLRDNPDFSLRLSLGTSAVSLSVPILAWSHGWIHYDFLHAVAGFSMLLGVSSVVHTVSGLVRQEKHTIVEAGTLSKISPVLLAGSSPRNDFHEH